MKTIFPAAILFLLFSCKKDNNVSDLKKDLTDTWEMQKHVCGECPTPYTVYQPGNGNTLSIYSNGEYEIKKHDTVIIKGQYLVEKKKVCDSQSSTYIFTTKQNSTTASYHYVDVNNSILTLSTPGCYADGAVSTYRKL